MKKYKLYDIYEEKETLGYFDTITEMRKAARQRFEDTDGECLVVFAELISDIQKYDFKHYKPLMF